MAFHSSFEAQHCVSLNHSILWDELGWIVAEAGVCERDARDLDKDNDGHDDACDEPRGLSQK